MYFVNWPCFTCFIWADNPYFWDPFLSTLTEIVRNTMLSVQLCLSFKQALHEKSGWRDSVMVIPWWIRVVSCEYSKFNFSLTENEMNFEYSWLMTRIQQGLKEIAKLVYVIGLPFIIAIWKWWILWPSPNLFSHFSHAELVKQCWKLMKV